MVVNVLNEHEKQLVSQLKAEVAPLVEQHACLRVFCNEHTYVRYLRARSWNLHKAAKMLRATLEWRLDYKPHLIKWEDVQSEPATGKLWLYHAVDKAGRPIVFMRPRNQNTKDTENQTRYLIYVLEMASRLADKSGVGKFAWLLDFQGYSLSNAPPLKVSLHCNSVLANHYPERLGLACCFHAPMLFSMTWKAVQPFIDPVTKEKIVFVDKGSHEREHLGARFNLDEIEQCMGGNLAGSAYDHDKFSVRMHAMDVEGEGELRAAADLMAAAASAGDRHQRAADAAAVGMSEGDDTVPVAAT